MKRINLDMDTHVIWLKLQDTLFDSSILGLFSAIVDAQTHKEKFFVLPKLKNNPIYCGFKYVDVK